MGFLNLQAMWRLGGTSFPRAGVAALSRHSAAAVFQYMSPLYVQKRGFALRPKPLPVEKLRNVAIIAHVDHGKTTLVDTLLKQGGVSLTSERLMDSNQLEKERGITILSKATRIKWKDHILNIVDTPGHADFGGEVERILSMVDAACLVVDLVEGPRTQTKFVLSKALLNPQLQPIVVINKVDRPCDRKPGEVENEIFDLFLNLEANDHQMDYPVLYASAKNGWCVRKFADINNDDAKKHGMLPIFETIVERVPPPIEAAPEKPFSMLVTLTEAVAELGYTFTGKVYSGDVVKGDALSVLTREGKVVGSTKVKSVTTMKGTTRELTEIAGAGDICSITCQGGVMPNVTDTLIAEGADVQPIPSRPIDPPVIFVEVSPNTSPLAGQDGKFLTLQALGVRLKKEALTNVAIEVNDSPAKDSFQVKGRGELQLGILLETMRREGYEMSVSPPTVVYKQDANGKPLEPWEEFVIELDQSLSSEVIERMSQRSADLVDMKTTGDTTRLKFHCASRMFLGMRPWLREISKGLAIVVSDFLDYRPKMPSQKLDRNGVIISSGTGDSTAFDLSNIQQKGTMFIGDGEKCYAGMIIGEHNTKDDIEMNCTRGKAITNVRSKSKDDGPRLIPPKQMPIEAALSYILEDEQVEITPKRVSMRKKILDAEQRKQAQRKAALGR
eukprot:GDKI01002822.1.p1 GENE.GDKI01002822.1~~GDKI01002822.1.p1  ORF type:complete len:671 (+),score=222.54 GDKI01002822.1:72-2084(+)